MKDAKLLLVYAHRVNKMIFILSTQNQEIIEIWVFDFFSGSWVLINYFWSVANISNICILPIVLSIPMVNTANQALPSYLSGQRHGYTKILFSTVFQIAIANQFTLVHEMKQIHSL